MVKDRTYILESLGRICIFGVIAYLISPAKNFVDLSVWFLSIIIIILCVWVLLPILKEGWTKHST